MLFVGAGRNMESLEANPLGEDYRPSPHLTKGGMRLSANVNYNCVKSDEKRPTAPLEAQFCCPICQVATQCVALQLYNFTEYLNKRRCQSFRCECVAFGFRVIGAQQRKPLTLLTFPIIIFATWKVLRFWTDYSLKLRNSNKDIFKKVTWTLP